MVWLELNCSTSFPTERLAVGFLELYIVNIGMSRAFGIRVHTKVGNIYKMKSIFKQEKLFAGPKFEIHWFVNCLMP